MTKILRVEAQTEPTTVNKKDGTQMQKCFVHLKGLGQYPQEYYGAVLGNNATVRFQKGDLVAADISFAVHENNGAKYQDVLVKEIVKLKN